MPPAAPNRIYAWGDQWNSGRANTRQLELRKTVVVNSYENGRSWFAQAVIADGHARDVRGEIPEGLGAARII